MISVCFRVPPHKFRIQCLCQRAGEEPPEEDGDPGERGYLLKVPGVDLGVDVRVVRDLRRRCQPVRHLCIAGIVSDQ